MDKRGQNDGIGIGIGRVPALHVGNIGSIPSTTYGPLVPTRNDS